MSQVKVTEQLTLDSWGVVTPDNIQYYRERTEKWKPSLLTLAKQVNQAMALYYSETKLTPQWFITDGTLLGAYRNGKMIPHDYDFDYGICFIREDGKIANFDQSRAELANVSRHLSDFLDKGYTVSTRNDYSSKIEIDLESSSQIDIYRESSGVQMVEKGYWYNVHLDMDMWFSPDELKFKIAYFRKEHSDVDIPVVFPLSEIEFEATTWPCPKDSRVFLESLYGYIGSPAKYNPITNLYEPL